jgi:hypothetical protein
VRLKNSLGHWTHLHCLPSNSFLPSHVLILLYISTPLDGEDPHTNGWVCVLQNFSFLILGEKFFPFTHQASQGKLSWGFIITSLEIFILYSFFTFYLSLTIEKLVPQPKWRMHHDVNSHPNPNRTMQLLVCLRVSFLTLGG